MKYFFIKKILIHTIVVLLVGASIFPITIVNASNGNGNTLYVGGTGPGNYTYIQHAIENASDGDTVFVFSGTYYESIVVDKEITLVGEDKNTTVIDAYNPSDVVVNISANNVTVKNFTITDATSKAMYVTSNNNIIDNNIFTDYDDVDCALHLSGSSNNKISNNIIGQVGYGGMEGVYMLFESSSYNTIENNYMSGYTGLNGIDFLNSDYNDIVCNILEDALCVGIGVVDSCYYNFTDNIIRDCGGGIGIDGGNNFCVYNNQITSSDTGINIYNYVPNIEIYNNTFSSQVYGVVCDSGGAIVRNNTFEKHTSSAIRFSGSGTASGNDITNIDAAFGVNIAGVKKCVITNNSLTNAGIFIDYVPTGDEEHEFFSSHTIDNNTVNGKPLYYYKNLENISVTGDPGQVIIANCDNVTLNNLSLSSSSPSMLMGYSSNVIVDSCTISNSPVGMHLTSSDNCSIHDSDLSEIYLIYLSNDNTLYNNTVRTTAVLIGSDDNMLYHNTFYGTVVDDEGENNIWNETYPTGGNYYGEYTGVDTDEDGIGDSPYAIPGGSGAVDNYPYIYPVVIPYAEWNYSINQTILEVTFNVTFENSYDSQIVNYTWDFDDGNYGYEKNTTHIYSEGKFYTVTLTVKNDKNKENSIEKSFYVISQNCDVMYVDDDYDESTEGWGLDHWNTIQDAVTYISTTGTIYVYNGTYYENIHIENKSINFIGENKNTTIIDAQYNLFNPSGPLWEGITDVSYAIYFENSDNSSVSGFKITNTVAVFFSFYSSGIIGIYSNLTIENNIFDDNNNGIYSNSDKFQKLIIQNNQIDYFRMTGLYLVKLGYESSINNNSVTGDYSSYGIVIVESQDCEITYNDVTDVKDYMGIYVYICDNITISNNILFDNYYGLYFSNIDNAIMYINNNNFSGNNYGMYITNFESSTVDIIDSGFDNNEYGLYFTNAESSNNISVSDASFVSNIYGMYITNFESNTVNISDSNIDSNTHGLYMTHSDSNNLNISNCLVSNNDNGIFLTQTYDNDFIARNNWWGSITGPYHTTNNPSGTGDSIEDGEEDDVLFDPWKGETDGIIYQGEVQTNTTSGGGTTEEINATDIADTTLNVNTSSPTNIAVANYTTSPGEELSVGIEAVGNYIDIEIEDDTVVNWPVNISIYYTQADLDNAGIAEGEIAGMYYYNSSSSTWHIYNDTGVNTTDQNGYQGYVWALAWGSDQLSPKIIGADSNPPITTKIIQGPKYDKNRDGEFEYVKSTSLFELISYDEGAGVKNTLYRIWENNNWTLWEDYTAPFTLSGQGLHYIEYYSVDKTGNTEETHNQTHHVDDTPPVTTYSVTGDSGENNWYTSNVGITLTADDYQAGVEETYYKMNDGSWQQYTETIQILSEGTHTLQYYSTDYLGNIETTKYETIKIDKTHPTINITKPRQGYLYIFNREIIKISSITMIIGWINITVMATDTGNGINRVEFYIDDVLKETDTTYPYEWLMDEPMFFKHTLKTVAYDNAGNTATDEIEFWIINP